MIHFVFIICAIAFVFPTFVGLPLTPIVDFYLIIALALSFFLNRKIAFGVIAGIVIIILLVHMLYYYFNFYNRNNTIVITNFILPFTATAVFFQFYSKKPLLFKTFVKFILVGLVSTAITTSIGLIFFPDASRQLAGALDSSGQHELIEFYMLIGIGDYTFTIYWLFLCLILLYMKGQNHTFFNPIAINFMLIIILIAMFSASYTTPILLLIFGMVLLKFRSYLASFKRMSTLVIVTYTSLYFSGSVLSSLLYFLAEKLDSTDISPRLNNIAQRLDGSITEFGFDKTSDIELSEENIYLGAYELRTAKSLNSFFNSPFIGGGEVGGHNFYFDILGIFGLVGFFLVTYLILYSYTKGLRIIREKDGKNLYRLIFIIFVILGVLKTYIILPFFFFVFFVIPLTINLITNQDIKLKPKNSNSSE